MDWIDIALRDDEAGVDDAIRGLDAAGRQAALASVAAELGLEPDDIERIALRLLIERARPLALPVSLWSRPMDASDDPRSHVRAHFKRRGIAATEDRLRRAVRLYNQFADERDHVRVDETYLTRCGYRCEHCGLAFCSEDLQRRTLVSPFGARGRLKSDPLKRHWQVEELREPTMDHRWPISLYGDNRHGNMKVLCKGCNAGKADYLAYEQLRPAVGLPFRPQFLGQGPLPLEVFYTQLRRAPVCVETGKTARDAELTVRLKDPHAPAVLDNLETVESPGL